MNIAERKSAHEALRIRLSQRVAAAGSDANKLAAVGADIKSWQAEGADIKRAEQMLVLRDGGSLSPDPDFATGNFSIEAKGLGKSLAPLHIPEAKALWEAARRNQPYATTKSAVSVTNLLPPQFNSPILAPAFEGRLLDHLPVMGMTAPAWEYVKHTGTTGSPAIVAEGAAKPELTPDIDKVIVSAVKIAAWTSATRESLSDYKGFQGYLTQDLLNQIVKVENNELLVQTGTTGHMDGLLHQAGLTHARATDKTESSLDALEIGIANMRAGSELCTPDLFVIHPTTWSIIRRLKNSQGEYLFAKADATAEAVNTIWGVPVLVTTDQPTGTGLFINNRFGTVLLRESLNVTADPYSASTNNVTKFIGEERLALAVERPNALLKVTGLGTDASDTAA